MYDLIIVGGGFSGTLSAIQALEDSKRFGGIDTIALIERSHDQLAGGVAFSRVTAGAFLETNTAIKNTAITKDDPGAMARFHHLNPKQVMTRSLMQPFLKAELAKAQSAKSSGIFPPAALEKITDQTAIDIIEDHSGVHVELDSSRTLTARAAILATGILQQREIPCIIDDLKNDDFFNARYVANQWLPEEQEKIAQIPGNADVLIVGTALSGYDGARTILRQKHRGDIWMVSRHGLEPFQYPREHNWQDITLPYPAFLPYLLNGEFEKAKKEAIREFKKLTGLKLDLDAQTIRPTLAKTFNTRSFYTPEQVLKQWEKHTGRILNKYDEKDLGHFLKEYSAMINVLRVGAGHDVCKEINCARDKGQLTVRALDIRKITPSPDDNGLIVEFRGRGRKLESLKKTFHTVVSSLGPDHDYTRIKDPLWRSVIDRGYTSPDPVGIGVMASTHGSLYGLLEHAEHIYGAGLCVAGNNIVVHHLLGPPAFSVNGMRDGIRKTASAAVQDVLLQHRYT